MQITTRRNRNGYVITTRDTNPATGKTDVLATVTNEGGFRASWHLDLHMPQHSIPDASVPQPVLDEARRYLAACELDAARNLIHPDVCNECSGFIPAAAAECPACAAFREAQAEGRRRLSQMFPSLAAGR